MFKILIPTIILTTFIFSDGSILQTGQTKSYSRNGDVVTDRRLKMMDIIVPEENEAMTVEKML